MSSKGYTMRMIYSFFRFSLCMEYEPQSDFFRKPDVKIKEFGDMAVVISEFNEFIKRYGKAFFAHYEHIYSMMDREEFYDYEETKAINPLFSKTVAYRYQKELRLVFAEVEPDRFALGKHADEAMRLVQSLARVKLQIGDIREIVYAIPIEDFLKLKLEDRPLHFPMRESGQELSDFDQIVEFTRE